PVSLAISSFVPTPSVDAASSRPSPRSTSPANPPTPSTTSGRPAEDAAFRIRSTARPPAATSTPDRRYASSPGRVTEPPVAGARPSPRLERELRRRLFPTGDGDRIFAVEARPAERGLGSPRGLDQRVQVEVGERVRAH